MESINGYQFFQNRFQQNTGKKRIKENASEQKGQQGICRRTVESKQTEQRSILEQVTKAKRNGASSVASDVQLSDGAKSLLEELKEKYQNMDFFVANCASDEEAQSYLSRGTKAYSVLIDPDTLEAMAADPETKEKYMNFIDEAASLMENVNEELGEDGEAVRSIGVKIDSEGITAFYAELQKVSDSQKEWMEQVKNKRTEDKKNQEKLEKKRAEKQEKETEQSEQNSGARQSVSVDTRITRVSASSVSELIEKIRSVDWTQVGNVKTATGVRFDFTV